MNQQLKPVQKPIVKYAGLAFSEEQPGVQRKLEVFACEFDITQNVSALLGFRDNLGTYQGAADWLDAFVPITTIFRVSRAGKFAAFEPLKAKLCSARLAYTSDDYMSLVCDGSLAMKKGKDVPELLPESTMKLLSSAHYVFVSHYNKKKHRPFSRYNPNNHPGARGYTMNR